MLRIVVYLIALFTLIAVRPAIGFVGCKLDLIGMGGQTCNSDTQEYFSNITGGTIANCKCFSPEGWETPCEPSAAVCYDTIYYPHVTCNTGYTPNTFGTACVPCTGCSGCTSIDWAAHNTGYQIKITKTCNCNTCNSSNSYRCAAGYYGSSFNGSTGCTKCPDGGTSAAGSTTITKCYMPANTSISNDRGTFEYTINCPYTN